MTLYVGDYNESLSGDWYADVLVPIATTRIDDGATPTVTVQLSNSYLCQLAGNGQAMATIVHPDVTISSPGETFIPSPCRVTARGSRSSGRDG